MCVCMCVCVCVCVLLCMMGTWCTVQIVQSCIHCLGAVVNNVTQNYTLVRDCFQKFFSESCSNTCPSSSLSGHLSTVLLEKVKALHSQNPQNSQLKALRPSLLRSAFTVGLLCKHFDVNSFMPNSTPVSQTGRLKNHIVSDPRTTSGHIIYESPSVLCPLGLGERD